MDISDSPRKSCNHIHTDLNCESFKISALHRDEQGCHVSGKCQGKTKLSQVREKSGNFEKMSGNFCHFTHVRELSGNFIIILYDYMIKALPGLCLYKCLLGKYKLKVY